MSNLLQWPIVILGLALVGAGITVAWLKLIDLILYPTAKPAPETGICCTPTTVIPDESSPLRNLR